MQIRIRFTNESTKERLTRERRDFMRAVEQWLERRVDLDGALYEWLTTGTLNMEDYIKWESRTESSD